jgi:hypothetical protein
LAYAIIRTDLSSTEAPKEGHTLMLPITILREGYERTVLFEFKWTASGSHEPTKIAVKGMPARLPLTSEAMRPDVFCENEGDCTILVEPTGNGTYQTLVEPIGDLEEVAVLSIGFDGERLSMPMTMIDVVMRDEVAGYISVQFGRTPASVDAGDMIRIPVSVKNIGTAKLTDVPIYLWMDGVSKKVDTVPELPSGASYETEIEWEATQGSHNITVTALLTEPAYEADMRHIEVRPKTEPTPLVNAGGLAIAIVLLFLMIVSNFIVKRLKHVSPEGEERSIGKRPYKNRR